MITVSGEMPMDLCSTMVPRGLQEVVPRAENADLELSGEMTDRDVDALRF
ncbi:hypothetical protein [Arthrobacter sp.]